MFGSRLLRGSLMSLWICMTTGCDESAPAPTPTPMPTLTEEQTRQTLTDAGLALAQPFEQDGLRIVPVVSTKSRDEDRYITLDEGLRSGEVEVIESGSVHASQQNANESASQQVSHGNQVNQVFVVNRGDKPLYLMPGEIILGGDQDRSIAKECLIANDGKPSPVEVFCVEHGRWGNRASSDNAQLLEQVADNIPAKSGQQASIDELSEKADKDQFVASPTIANKSVRIAVQQSANQSKVWEEVAKVNAKSGAQSQSGSLTFNYTQKESAKRLKPYRDALREPVSEVPNIVGVVVVIHGEPQSVDVFGTTPLFKKLWPKLLEGYALDAATRDVTESELPYTPEVPAQFLAQVLKQSSGDAERRGTISQRGTIVAAASEAEFEAAYAETDLSAVPLHVAGYSSETDLYSESSDQDSSMNDPEDHQQQIDYVEFGNQPFQEIEDQVLNSQPQR